MKLYEKYLFDERNKSNNSSIDINDMLNKPETIRVQAIYATIINLMQLTDIALTISPDYFMFNRTLAKSEHNIHTISSSKLSRNKIMKANSFDVANAIIELVLDRENWKTGEGVFEYKEI
jgi:hypothetical protein